MCVRFRFFIRTEEITPLNVEVLTSYLLDPSNDEGLPFDRVRDLFSDSNRGCEHQAALNLSSSP